MKKYMCIIVLLSVLFSFHFCCGMDNDAKLPGENLPNGCCCEEYGIIPKEDMFKNTGGNTEQETAWEKKYLFDTPIPENFTLQDVLDSEKEGLRLIAEQQDRLRKVEYSVATKHTEYDIPRLPKNPSIWDEDQKKQITSLLSQAICCVMGEDDNNKYLLEGLLQKLKESYAHRQRKEEIERLFKVECTVATVPATHDLPQPEPVAIDSISPITYPEDYDPCQLKLIELSKKQVKTIMDIPLPRSNPEELNISNDLDADEK